MKRLAAIAIAITLGTFACKSQDAAPADDTSSGDQVIFVAGNADHAAIVEASTIMLVTTHGLATPVDPRLDRYNEADPFDIGNGDFKETFAANLDKFDALDGNQDWSDEQRRAWTSRMANGNYLIVDTEKTCNFDDAHTYLEIERAAMRGEDHATCGGRMPNEDALDVTMNFLVGGANNDGSISDGVDSPTKPSTRDFPYLAEMNGI